MRFINDIIYYPSKKSNRKIQRKIYYDKTGYYVRWKRKFRPIIIINKIRKNEHYGIIEWLILTNKIHNRDENNQKILVSCRNYFYLPELIRSY